MMRKLFFILLLFFVACQDPLFFELNDPVVHKVVFTTCDAEAAEKLDTGYGLGVEIGGRSYRPVDYCPQNPAAFFTETSLELNKRQHDVAFFFNYHRDDLQTMDYALEALMQDLEGRFYSLKMHFDPHTFRNTYFSLNRFEFGASYPNGACRFNGYPPVYEFRSGIPDLFMTYEVLDACNYTYEQKEYARKNPWSISGQFWDPDFCRLVRACVLGTLPDGKAFKGAFYTELRDMREVVNSCWSQFNICGPIFEDSFSASCRDVSIAYGREPGFLNPESKVAQVDGTIIGIADSNKMYLGGKIENNIYRLEYRPVSGAVHNEEGSHPGYMAKFTVNLKRNGNSLELSRPLSSLQNMVNFEHGGVRKLDETNLTIKASFLRNEDRLQIENPYGDCGEIRAQYEVFAFSLTIDTGDHPMGNYKSITLSGEVGFLADTYYRK